MKKIEYLAAKTAPVLFLLPRFIYFVVEIVTVPAVRAYNQKGER